MLLAMGCAEDGSLPSPDPSPSPGISVSFARVQQEVFDAGCTAGGCHATGANAGGLVLEEGRSWANIVGVVPANQAAAQANLLLVSPGQPEGSFLYRKLTGEIGPGQGSRMPLGAPILEERRIALVRQWIEEGAAPAANPTATATRGESPPGTSTATPPIEPSVPRPSPSATASPAVTPVMPTAGASPSPTASATPTPSPAVFDPATTLERLQQDVFTPTCATAFCHDGTFASAGLNLTEGQSHSALVGVLPTNAAARARGWLRVEPGVPERSFLLLKCRRDLADPTLGSRMPLGASPLDDEVLARIEAWILRGAPAVD